MMTKIYKLGFKKLVIYTFLFSLCIFSFFGEEKKWVVAAEKFTFSKGQNENSVTQGMGEAIPKNILENLNQTLERNIKPYEELERVRYDLRKKRQSLYLQLSSEYKKRDVLFLNYSGKKLTKKLTEQEEKINNIKQQIDDNIAELKKAEAKQQKIIEEKAKGLIDDDFTAGRNEKKSSSFFKNLITNDEAVIQSEQVKLYQDSINSLVEISEKSKESGYESSTFEKEIYEKGINSLITGNISSYGGYVSVTVDLYLYPGAKKIGSVMEVGSFNDMELITSSIVRQLIPLLTNSMPVTVYFSINPEDVGKKAEIYIDEILQKIDGKKLIINSGVHTFKIAAQGYKSLSTSYFFEGNRKYSIEVNLEEKSEGQAYIQLRNSVMGDFFINGEMAEKLNDKSSKITVNGNKVLGQFIAEDGNTSFFYIPEKLYFDDSVVSLKPKPEDRGEKINKRRLWMYGAYSAFMVSLIPSFITRGTYFNKLELYNLGVLDYNTTNSWKIASEVCLGLSIGLGVFWGFELVRYLIAANSVLPEKAKTVHLMDLDPDVTDDIQKKNNEVVDKTEIDEKNDNIRENSEINSKKSND